MENEGLIKLISKKDQNCTQFENKLWSKPLQKSVNLQEKSFKKLIPLELNHKPT